MGEQRYEICFSEWYSVGACFLRFRNGGFCAKKMIRDAVVKSYSIGICTMLLCISIGLGRAGMKIARKSIESDALITGTSQP